MATVLVVDDNDIFGDTLATLLAHAGHRSVRVSSGQAALDSIGRAAPDVVLLDLFMSGMSGLETLKLIRQNATTTQVPVVMISAMSENEEIQIALENGANEFWVKTTFDFDELNRRLGRYEPDAVHHG